MSNSIEDFIISLGFDTSKIKSQVQAVHKELEKLAVNVDAKRVKSGLAATKTVATNEIKVAKETAKAKEEVSKKSTKKQAIEKEKILSDADKKRIEAEKQNAKTLANTRKQAALTRLRNQIAEYERSTVGPSNLSNRYKYYERGNASLTKINAFTEEIRGKNVDTRNRMKADGSLKSFDNASAAKAEMDMMKASNSMEVLRTRMSKMGMDTVGLDKALVDAKDLSSMKMLIEKTKHQINLEKELNKGRVASQKITVKTDKAHDAHIVQFQKQQLKAAKAAAKIEAMRPSKSSIQSKMNAYDQKGLLPRGFSDAIFTGAMKQSSERQADQYIKASMRAAEYSNRGVGNKKDTMKIISEGNVQVLSKANMQLASMNAKMAAVERRAIGAAAAFGGMQDSARNMVREMASIYALAAATSAINQTGQTFEGLNSAMLAATGNPEDAAKQMQFMIDLSKRLGLSVKDITDQYIKFKFAANGKLDTEQIEEIYTSTAELGTVLGLSQEKMKLTFNSMSQMMSKTTVMSEELKGQMAESFPSAVQLFAKAMNVSEKELFKLMEQGQVISAEVLPKVAKEMRKAAMAGGALEQKLTSTRVAQGQFTAAMQLAQDKIFKSGFGEGLAGLFQTMTESMNDNGETLIRIGKIYEKVFNGLAIVVKGATAFIESFVRVLETLWVSMKWGIENPIMGLLAALPLITLAVADLGKVMAVAFRSPMIILTTIVGLFDEIRAFFDENVDGLFDDENATNAEAAATAAQRRLLFGIGKKGDKALAGGESLVDLTGLTQFGENIGLNAADASAWLTRNKGGEANILDKALSFVYGIAKTNYDMGANDPTSFRYISAQREKQAANVTFHITSTEPKQAADETWSIFSNFFGDSTEARR